MKILLATILLLLPLTGSGQVSIQQVNMNTLASVQYDHSKLSSDIQTIGGNPELATGIQQYFTNKKEYLTIEERDEWINLVQYSIEQLNIKSFGAVRSKEELLIKLNYLIGEHSKVVSLKAR